MAAFPPFTGELLVALAEVVKPRRDGFELPVEAAMAEAAASMLARVPPPLSAVLPLGVRGFDLGPRVLGFGGRFRDLPLADRVAYVRRIEASPAGPHHEVLRVLRGLLLFGFYELPEVGAHLGYDADAWIAEAIAVRDERYGKPVFDYTGGPSGYLDLTHPGPLTQLPLPGARA